MQDTQEVQEIEQGQEVQEVNKEKYIEMPAGAGLEDFEIVWKYWGDKSFPSRITDNFTAIWAGIIETAKKEGVSTATLMDEFLRGNFNKDGYPTNDKHRAIVERAEHRNDIKSTHRVKYNKLTQLTFSTDKLSNVFFSANLPGPNIDANGQRHMLELYYEGADSKKEITLFYDYTWDEKTLLKFGLDRSFTDYDFFMTSILDNLYLAGNDEVSFSKLYRELGGKGAPAGKSKDGISKHKTKMFNSLIKGQSTIMHIDNREVLEAWKKMPEDGTYEEFHGSVMPIYILDKKFAVNGQIADFTIKILGLSPFYYVAAPIGHITSWDKSILSLYTGGRTDRYYSVLRYLMQQIGMMRNPKTNRNNKILYSSLCEHTRSTTYRDKKRTIDMMYKVLKDVFIKAGYISAYKETEKTDPNPGVFLTLCRKRMQIEEK